VVGARSALFHLCSLLCLAVFLPFAVLVWAPLWVGLPVYKALIGAQTWLLRVICGQSYALDLDAVPEGPAIYALRHEAMWESLVLPAALGDPVVFMKDDIARYPIFGAVARKLGYIALDRSGSPDKARAAFHLARERAREGASFFIFPSGTRNPARRDQVQKGVAVLYRVLDLPCVPIVLNSGTYWPFQSWLRYPGVIRVRALPAIAPGLTTAAFLEQLEHDLSQPV
jgi:1-acyl-sn-glycerol-3-phosphate acyltransferase